MNVKKIITLGLFCATGTVGIYGNNVCRDNALIGGAARRQTRGRVPRVPTRGGIQRVQTQNPLPQRGGYAKCVVAAALAAVCGVYCINVCPSSYIYGGGCSILGAAILYGLIAYARS